METTRSEFCANDNFPHQLASAFRNQAQLAMESMDATAGSLAARHVAALNEFANYVTTLELHDPRLHALYLIQGSFGSTDEFTPREKQVDLLHKLGYSRAAPEPVHTIVELIAAGIEDLISLRSEQAAPGQEAIARVAELEPFQEEAQRAHAEIERLEDELARSRDEVQALHEQRDFLRERLTDGKQAEARAESTAQVAAEAGKQKPRRVRVEGHTGVYERETPDGTSYEIGWTEDGRQRWQTIGPNLEEAVAERERRLTALPV